MSNRINTISFNIDIAPKAHDMGRNLLRGAGLTSLDSMTDGGITSYRINSMSASLVKIVDGVDGNKGVWVKTNGGETNLYRGVFFTAAVNKGETYTLSAWVKGTAGQTLTLEVINSTGTARKNSDGTDGTRYTGAGSVATLTGGWQRVSYTFTVVDKNAGYVECNFFTNAVGEYTISEPKLERGDAATAFCLNEADLKGEKGDKGDQGIRGLQGLQGEKGDQGIQGEKGDTGAAGKDGVSTYFHIAYADNATGGGFSQSPTGKNYIGTYVDHTATDSTNPSAYKWQLVKGAQGEQGEKGIPGTNGTDGKTSYLHIAYANSADGKDGFDVSNSTGKLYIGQYVDFVEADSNDYTKYSWTKIKGEQGDAATVYTIEAVDNSNNSGTLKDASTIAVTLIGKLKLYKTVGSEKTEALQPPQCWRLTVGGTNVDGTNAFTNSGGNISYSYAHDYSISSDGNSSVPGSATVSVYKGNTMSELLASLVIPITLNPNAIVDVNAKLGKITNTTTSMRKTIETIEQGQGKISLKVQALGMRNLLMDSEFRCPVERAITRNGKKYREAWNNGTAVSVTDTANGINAEGINAVKAYSPTADGDWTVTRWYVPARPGQAYTASVWRMVPDTGTLASDSLVMLQLFACKDDLTRDGSYKAYAVFGSPSPGTWARTAATLTMPDDTTHPYIEVALAAYRCGTVYFRQPQLEYGSEATDWTRCADDVEGGLLATGVDIESGQITLTADNVTVRNNSGTRIALFGTKQDGTPFLNTDLIYATAITVNRLMAYNGDTLRTSINQEGNGEFIQYYPDGKKKMEIANGNIIYYNDDTKNSLKWIIGENGTSETIDNWSEITLCKTDETGSNVQTRGTLIGEDFSVFNTAVTSVNAKYIGLTVKGKQSSISPTDTGLKKIPDGWYTDTGFAYIYRNADGTSSARRTLYEYIGGYSKRVKLISFDAGKVLVPGGDYTVTT